MNVVSFPQPNLNDIPRMMRKFADDIEAGEWGEVQALFVILERDAGLDTFGFGATDEPLRNIGLLEAAKVLQIQLVIDGIGG